MGGLSKGFDSPKPDLSVVPPIEKLNSIATTAPRLEQLLAEILKHRLSLRAYGMMKRYAQMPPAYRLAVSLKTVIGLMADKDVTDVMSGGLTKDERGTLSEIDGSGMSLESRRTAHSLLDIEFRTWQIDAFSRIFRDMGTRSKHVLTDKLLD